MTAASTTLRLFLLTALASGLLLIGCDTTGDSLYEPDRATWPAPVVQEVAPQDTVGAVVPITITGQNFAADPDSNLVYFGGRRAYVAEASPTEMVVHAPDVPDAQDMPLKLTTIGARRFSSETPYRIQPAVQAYGNLTDREEPFAIATDGEGAVYVSILEAGSPSGIFRINPEGEKALFAENAFKWDAFEVGPESGLFGVRNVRAIFRFPPEGGSREVWFAIPGTASLLALDIDVDGNVWTAGRAPAIYRVTPDKQLAEFAFDHNVRAVERFEDVLYVLAVDTQTNPSVPRSVLWRFPVAADATLGEGEVVFRITEQVRIGPDQGAQAYSLAAAQDGTLFIGLNGSDPLLLWHPDGSLEFLYPDAAPYPDVAGLERDARYLAWGPGPFLYYSQGGTVAEDGEFTPQLMRLNTLTYRSAE